jgi:hypothetical protein
MNLFGGFVALDVRGLAEKHLEGAGGHANELAIIGGPAFEQEYPCTMILNEPTSCNTTRASPANNDVVEGELGIVLTFHHSLPSR